MAAAFLHRAAACQTSISSPCVSLLTHSRRRRLSSCCQCYALPHTDRATRPPRPQRRHTQACRTSTSQGSNFWSGRDWHTLPMRSAMCTEMRASKNFLSFLSFRFSFESLHLFLSCLASPLAVSAAFLHSLSYSLSHPPVFLLQFFFPHKSRGGALACGRR